MYDALHLLPPNIWQAGPGGSILSTTELPSMHIKQLQLDRTPLLDRERRQRCSDALCAATALPSAAGGGVRALVRVCVFVCGCGCGCIQDDMSGMFMLQVGVYVLVYVCVHLCVGVGVCACVRHVGHVYDMCVCHMCCCREVVSADDARYPARSTLSVRLLLTRPFPRVRCSCICAKPPCAARLQPQRIMQQAVTGIGQASSSSSRASCTHTHTRTHTHIHIHMCVYTHRRRGRACRLGTAGWGRASGALVADKGRARRCMHPPRRGLPAAGTCDAGWRAHGPEGSGAWAAAGAWGGPKK